MKFLKLAWRNIWRNKKRTLIAAGSLYFSIVFAIFMRSMQLGSYDIMIDNAVETYSGYIQIQDSSFWNDKSMDDMMEFSKELNSKILSEPGVKGVNPRLESFALASSGVKTKGVFVQAIDPEKDDEMTNMSKRLISGNYIKKGDHGVVLSARLAVFMGLQVGDTVVFLSQGYQGVTAADKFTVRGIIKIAIPNLDSRLVIMPLDAAQNFYSAPNLVTSLSLNIEGGKGAVEEIEKGLEKKLANTNLKVLSWLEINPILQQQIDSDNSSGIIMLIILYMVIFFGILGTIIMMTTERMKEFGVMVAVGMKRTKLMLLTLLESLLIGLLGISAGLITTLPFIYYLYLNPIKLTGEMARATEQYGMEPLLAFSIDPWLFVNQFITVLLLMAVTLSYPAYKILNLKIINALRG